MTYGNAYELTANLQTILGDTKNVVVKKAAADGSNEFSTCVRRISFSAPIMQIILNFVKNNNKQIFIKVADPEVCPEEKYEPRSGEWKSSNLVAIIY